MPLVQRDTMWKKIQKLEKHFNNTHVYTHLTHILSFVPKLLKHFDNLTGEPWIQNTKDSVLKSVVESLFFFSPKTNKLFNKVSSEAEFI